MGESSTGQSNGQRRSRRLNGLGVEIKKFDFFEKDELKKQQAAAKQMTAETDLPSECNNIITPNNSEFFSLSNETKNTSIDPREGVQPICAVAAAQPELRGAHDEPHGHQSISNFEETLSTSSTISPENMSSLAQKKLQIGKDHLQNAQNELQDVATASPVTQSFSKNQETILLSSPNTGQNFSSIAEIFSEDSSDYLGSNLQNAVTLAHSNQSSPNFLSELPLSELCSPQNFSSLAQNLTEIANPQVSAQQAFLTLSTSVNDTSISSLPILPLNPSSSSESPQTRVLNQFFNSSSARVPSKKIATSTINPLNHLTTGKPYAKSISQKHKQSIYPKKSYATANSSQHDQLLNQNANNHSNVNQYCPVSDNSLGAGRNYPSGEPTMAMHGNFVGCESSTFTPQGMFSNLNSFNHTSSSRSAPNVTSAPRVTKAPVLNAWGKSKPNKMNSHIAELLSEISLSSPTVSNMRAPPMARYDNSIRFSFAHINPEWVKHNYFQLLHKIADLFPDGSSYHIFQRIEKGYVDIPLHSASEFQAYKCQPLRFNGEVVKVLKTRSSKDPTLWIHFADLPSSLPPKDVEAAIVCGLKQFGKVVDFVPHGHANLPAKFGVPTASACIVPFQKYQLDVSLIPRMAVLGDHSEVFQVNPESARPYCTWCNTLGHLAQSCKVRRPARTSQTSTGNKRSHALRDAIVVQPTQWLPQELWSISSAHSEYASIKGSFPEKTRVAPCINVLPIGAPTQVCVPDPGQRKVVSKRLVVEAHKESTLYEKTLTDTIPKGSKPKKAQQGSSNFNVTNNSYNKAINVINPETESFIDEEGFTVSSNRTLAASVHKPIQNTLNLSNAFDISALAEVEASLNLGVVDMHLDNNNIDEDPPIPKKAKAPDEDSQPSVSQTTSSVANFFGSIFSTPLSGGEDK